MLAWGRWLRCNASLFNFKGASLHESTATTQLLVRHPQRDALRCTLFGGCRSFAGTNSLHLVAPPIWPREQGHCTVRLGIFGGASSGGVSTAAAAAFDKADSNKDGQLSAQEAATLPAISQRFKELDTDKNGSLSRAEFDKGVQS